MLGDECGEKERQSQEPERSHRALLEHRLMVAVFSLYEVEGDPSAEKILHLCIGILNNYTFPSDSRLSTYNLRRPERSISILQIERP